MLSVLTLENGSVVPGKLQSLRSRNTTWLDIVNPTPEELNSLEEFTLIPAIQMVEWLEGKKRPTAMDFQKYSVVTFLAPTRIASKNGKSGIITEPCLMLISNDKNDFITIHKNVMIPVDEIKAYSEKHLIEIFKQRATFILFTLLDEIIEDYYTALDLINDILREAEELALSITPKQNLMQRVLNAKKSMIYFHKALISNREVISAIEHEHLTFLDEQILRQFRMLSSSITQLIEINSTYRDILNTTTEIHLTAISNSLNITMKKVTSWGSIILVPSLIASVFGMNFKHVPAFEWNYGLELSVGLMVFSVAVLYWFFKRKDWL